MDIEEYENKQEVRASLLTLISVLIAVLIIVFVELFVTKTANVGVLIIGFTALASLPLYKGIVFRKTWLIVVGTFAAIIALALFIGWVVLL